VTDKPKILCLGPDVNLPEELLRAAQVSLVNNPLDALKSLSDGGVAGVFVSCNDLLNAGNISSILQSEQILDGLPDGVVLLDCDNKIIWANRRLLDWTSMSQEDIVGQGFYTALKGPEILGPDFCPFHSALATRRPSTSSLRVHENQYFQTHAAPVFEGDAEPSHLIVTVRDNTVEMLQRQKLAAIHKAGIALADLTPGEIYEMEVEDRIELLKSNILHYTQDLLKFDVVEIRLLDQQSGELAPLLSMGIDDEAANRPLFARPTDNGVTGFVAATGQSYLCEDVSEDPLYIEGFKGARSSLTVPLILHDQVIGSFNVESPESQAFTESDLQFLEIFARDLAVSLNTLELLVAQKAEATQESVEAIHSAVALPIDEILNEAVNVMERYIGHEPHVVDRLHRILRNARDIKRVIQKVGQTMTPIQVVPASTRAEARPMLVNRRVLVVDADDSVRNDAHALLEKYGCDVETAHEGGEAIMMVRNCDEEYDAIIADIRLPDLSGYELLVRLRDVIDPVPLILMTSFGYDPGHSIVKARQSGLHAKAVLYKPFRLDQLVQTVEAILEANGKVAST